MSPAKRQRRKGTPPSSGADGYVNRDFCARSLLAAYREAAANLFHAFPHAHQSKTTRGAVLSKGTRETTSVIPHHQLHAPRLKHQINKYAARPRVFHRIVDCFLSDAKQIVFD